MNDEINENNDEINENKELTKSFMRIIDILQLFPKITIPELAQKIGMSTKTTERKLLKMRSLEMIQRVGSRKSGSWYVIDKKHQ
jgi:ATP-dependent DNA helicase RecG